MKIQVGEYIIFIDADDYLEPNMLSELYGHAKSENSDIVICDYYEVYDSTKKPISAMENFSDDVKINYMLSNPSPWNKLIKSKILKENNIKFLENYIYEDMATMPILIGYIDTVTYIKKPLYNYIIRSGSTMRQKNYNKKLDSIFIAIKFLEDEFKSRNLYEKYNEELEFLVINHLLYAASGRFLQYPEGKQKLRKIKEIIKCNYNNWKNNKYYKLKGLIYKTTCNIFYIQNPIILKLYCIIRHK